MTTTNSAPNYALGSTDAEHERLIRQAALLAPFTERFFRSAGIGPGQRVLDLGSGVGDVAMLAAKLVGPSGEVVGVERDPRSIARAGARVADAGLPNVTFTQSDVSQISSSKPFDAVVGRFILMFLSDPLAVLRSLTPLGSGCFPRTLLGAFSSACRAPAALVCGHFADSRNFSAFRRKHGDGVRSLPDFPAGGTVSTNHESGDAARQ